ncbi:MAG: hypothetical protein SVS15_10285 [Thermodesulfobacteriota bacterium]|nr:hypothetical protein [Thermodesulfobacteriota bacterium]
MSKQEVMVSEQGEPQYQKDNVIGYEVTVLSKNFLALYFFIQNKLVRARYALDVEHTNKNDFIYEYEEIKKTLTTKYGPPTSDNTLWANDSYKDDRSRWGFAISLGYLAFSSTWETEETEILNYVSGENLRVYCVIEYISKKLIHLEEQQQHKKNMEAF